MAESRFLAWLALKFGRNIGGDLRQLFKQLLIKMLNKYPQSQPLIDGEKNIDGVEDSDGVVSAGEGIGGGRGSDHPAAKLVRQEQHMLKTLHDLL